MPGCPENLLYDAFHGERQENEEGDYLIVTPRHLVKFVLDQLEDLGYVSIQHYNEELDNKNVKPVQVYNIQVGKEWKSLISIKLP